LNDAHRAGLAAIIESGPIPAIHGVVRWRIVDPRQWICEEFRVVISEQTLSRVLHSSRAPFSSCYDGRHSMLCHFPYLPRAPNSPRLRALARAGFFLDP
jgi:hypothetical protein